MPYAVIKNKIWSLFKKKEPEPLELPTELESSKERLRRFWLCDAEQDDKQDDTGDDKQDENKEDLISEYTPSVIPP